MVSAAGSLLELPPPARPVPTRKVLAAGRDFTPQTTFNFYSSAPTSINFTTYLINNRRSEVSDKSVKMVDTEDCK